ncbi:MAG: ribonuclease Z [Deltaproteobacteria bacterium]|nr:ribonuclease Z [Deltaproteobacteria bacterium]
MSVRELIVLGTSSQVPTRYRNHNGYLLRWDDEGILFDPGEGTQRQMIYADVTATSITRVMITHFHGDHCLGLAGMSQRLSLDRVPHPVHIHFPASGQVFYDRLRRASIYHAVAELVPHPIRQEGILHEDERLILQCRRLDHGVDTYGYRLEERDRRTMLPDVLAERGVRGRAIGELQRNGEVTVDGQVVRLDEVSVPCPGQRVAFVMDTRPCRAAIELAEGVDMLIIESTYLSSEQREANDHGHMTARQAATIAREAGAKLVVLTHFSQRYQSLDPFLKEARAIHPNVVVAKDGRRIPIPRRQRSDGDGDGDGDGDAAEGASNLADVKDGEGAGPTEALE